MPTSGGDDATTEADARGRDRFSLELMAGTTAPLDIWGGARLAISRRWLLSASIGRSVYGGLTSSMVSSFGSERAGAIVSPLFEDAWVMRLGVGVRPFGSTGPELIVGYTRVGAMASWDSATLSLPPRVGTLSAHVSMNMIHAELGWSIGLFGRFFLRPALGLTKTFRARVSLSSSTSAQQSAATLQTVQETIEGTLVDYGMTPTLSLALGARF